MRILLVILSTCLISSHGTFFSLHDLIRWIPFISKHEATPRVEYDKGITKFSDVTFNSTPRYWIPLIQETEDGELKYSFTMGSGKKFDQWVPIRKQFVNINNSSTRKVEEKHENEDSETTLPKDREDRPYVYYPDPIRPLLEERSSSFLKLLDSGNGKLISKAKTFFVPVEKSWEDLDEEGYKQMTQNETEGILYHLSPDSLSFKDLMQTDILLNTLISEKIRVNVNDKLNISHVNGVKILESRAYPEEVFVHIVEKPLYPIIRDNIRQTLVKDGRFTNILRVNQLINVNLEEQNMTVFAPTDKAFSELPPGTMEDLFTWKVFASALKKIAGRYFCRGASLMAIDLINHNRDIPTSPDIKFTSKNGKVLLNGKAMIVEKDIFATNGIIQVINKVIL